MVCVHLDVTVHVCPSAYYVITLARMVETLLTMITYGHLDLMLMISTGGKL